MIQLGMLISPLALVSCTAGDSAGGAGSGAIIHVNQVALEIDGPKSAVAVVDAGQSLAGVSLLGADGEPKRDHYVFDGLHLSDQGYAVWAEIIGDRLQQELGPLQ